MSSIHQSCLPFGNFSVWGSRSLRRYIPTVHVLGSFFHTLKYSEGKRNKQKLTSVHDTRLCAFQTHSSLHALLKRQDCGSHICSWSLRDLPTMNLVADNWLQWLTSSLGLSDYTINFEEIRSTSRKRKWDPLDVPIPFAAWGQPPIPYTSQQVCMHSSFSLQLPCTGIFHPEKVANWFQVPWLVILPCGHVLWVAQPLTVSSLFKIYLATAR